MTATLALLAKYNGTFGENAREAGQVALLGMGMIFAVLAILWGVIELLHLALGRQKKAEPAPAADTPAVPEAEESRQEDAGELVAVITAAIAAARAEEGKPSGFRVVRFHRASR